MNHTFNLGIALVLLGTCEAKSQYLQVPMNMSTPRLSPGFLGHDEIQVYEGTFGKQVPRGKYETTPQYKIRSKKAGAMALFGKVYMWSPLAFAVSPSWCDYNPDTRKLDAHFALAKDIQLSGMNFSANFDSSKEVLNGLTRIWTDNEGSYDAQNGFGAGVRVYTKSERGYGFQIVNWQEFPFVQFDGNRKYRVSCSIIVPPSDAASLEKRIRVLYIGHLTSPYRAQDYASERATYSTPFSFNAKYSYACIRLKSIWFYDIVTGRIYGKMSDKNSKVLTKSSHSSERTTFAKKRSESRLRMQDEGEEVKKWQLFLINRRLMSPPALGNFGERTEKATKVFQRKYGLIADGVVGPQTLKKAKELGYR